MVVTDYYPAYFLPRMLTSAAAQAATALEAVDSNGLIPLAAGGKAFPLARLYRAFLQRELPSHLDALPDDAPLAGLRQAPPMPAVPSSILDRWPAADRTTLNGRQALAALPIDHGVGVVEMRGGHRAAQARLDAFVARQVDGYDEARNHPDADATSRLSPYLHFGHLSAHTIFHALMNHERWTRRRLGPRAGGKREGWWGRRHRPKPSWIS